MQERDGNWSIEYVWRLAYFTALTLSAQLLLFVARIYEHTIIICVSFETRNDNLFFRLVDNMSRLIGCAMKINCERCWR